MSPARATDGALAISRYQLDMLSKCRRCFWLVKRHGVKLPSQLPMALNLAMDTVLKAEFDVYRAQGALPPILAEKRIAAKLFTDVEKLQEWRNNFRGLRWTDPNTGHTLFGAIDDLLEYPDGSVAVIDYKSSGAREAMVYPSYQLQMDVYTFLLRQLGYATAPRAYLAVFLAVKDGGFGGRLPFRPALLEITPEPDRVPALFRDAIAVAQAAAMPPAGGECDLCRWFDEAGSIRNTGR